MVLAYIMLFSGGLLLGVFGMISHKEFKFWGGLMKALMLGAGVLLTVIAISLLGLE